MDLRDTDKSQYLAITEFNNCFIIRSPSLSCGVMGFNIGTIFVSRGEMTSNGSLTFWYCFQVAFSYTYELRPYLDLLLQMLLITDSWQNHRIHNTLKGKNVWEF